MTTPKRTVLIIDDCQEDRETYRRYLLQDPDYTYVLLEAEYGEEGLEMCRLVKPDSVLLDYQLPDLDGLEFIHELQDATGRVNIPVVMVTGYGSEAVAVQAMKQGASDYLVKGHTTPQSLRLALHHAMEKAELLQRLQASEERFRTSVENMLDCFGIYTSIRDRTGVILDFRVDYVNDAACDDNRMTREEQLGRPLCEILPAIKSTGLFAEYCQVVETGEPLIKESLLYDGCDQLPKLTQAFDIRVTKLGDGLAVTWRDITQQKQLEAALKVAREEAESANRAKDEFLAIVSHELRSPLSAILGWTRVLRMRQMEPEIVEKALATIENHAWLQNQLIEDLMDMSRIVRGELRLQLCPTPLLPTITAAIDTVRLSAEAKQIHIKSVLDENIEDEAVLGDASRLQQVFWNLLSNAVKFTPEGGQIQVRLSRVSGELNSNSALITVADTGQGISADFLPYVFDQFRQAEGSNNYNTGLGLGLAIAKRLVELHDGTITAESAGEDKGATFSVRLPLYSGES